MYLSEQCNVVCADVYTRVYMYLCICMCVCLMYVYLCVCVSVHVFTCKCVRGFVYMRTAPMYGETQVK
jgi:hypothetical protein